MPIIARENAPLLPFTFQPEGEEVQFKLRGLTTSEMLDVQGNATLDVENKSMNWTRRSVQAALQAGLLGWDGLKDYAGNPVEFSKRAGDNIERLGYLATMMVFGKIMEASSLTGEQAKN